MELTQEQKEGISIVQELKLRLHTWRKVAQKLNITEPTAIAWSKKGIPPWRIDAAKKILKRMGQA